ncbi:hypothetical protein EDD11_005933 [Mortierella claussenii]|nr:hypothetical protein EDD11_005933 [Mortierella claussenii]
MDEEYQSFRLESDGPLTRIEVSTDEETGLKVVFWDDIAFQFPGIHCVKNKDIAISFARDAKRRRIEPLCIKYHPGVVLDVILSSNVAVHDQGSTLQRSIGSVGSSLSVPIPYSDSSSVGHFSPIDDTQGSPLAQTFSNLFVDTSYGVRDGYRGIQRQDTGSTMIRTPSSLSRSPSTSRSSTNTPWEMSSSEPKATTPTASQLVPRIQSTLQASAQLFGHFEQSIKSGQMHQAESIKQEIRDSFTNLQAEVARNQELQLQMLELQRTAAEMQQRMLTMQQQALDRLSVIQSRVQALLTQTYELHEYPIPRLFIVLPREPQRRDTLLRPFTSRFRLYFLCECRGNDRQLYKPLHDHRPNHHPHHSTSARSIASDGSGSSMSVDSVTESGLKKTPTQYIHLAMHEGYDLDRPNEFFRKYGTHILTLLQMLKYGVVAAGFIVSPLANLKLADGIDKVQRGLEFTRDMEPKVDYAIQYLESLAQHYNTAADGVDDLDIGLTPDGSHPDRNSDGTKEQVQDPTSSLEALEGADLRHLSTFLKVRDEGRALGNLYRIVTNEGHVKWVCLDHYRENYRDSAIQQFRDAVAVNNGLFEEATGKVSIRLSSSAVAKQFMEALERAKFIQELILVLNWETTLEDLRLLRDSIRKTNVVSLKLDFCNMQGPARDLFNRSRRYDPVLQTMANTKIQAFHVARCDGFWSRLTKIVVASNTHLRVLSVQGAIESWKIEQHRIKDLLQHSPRLTDLRLQCSDVDVAFELVKSATSGFRHLEFLELNVSLVDVQEQVHIEIDQPQAQITSMVIMTNKKPYTQLVFSGHVRNLVLYDGSDLVTKRTALETIIQNNHQLQELEVHCSIHFMISLFRIIMASCKSHTELRNITVEDTDRRNKLFSTNPQDPQVTVLELLSPESTERVDLLREYGWALRVAPQEMQFSPALLQGLEHSLRTNGSHLYRAHLDISTLGEDSLELLAKVVELAQGTLKRIEITIAAVQYQQREMAISALARFVIRVGPYLTHLHLQMYGLSTLLFALASAALAAQQASASSLTRTFTLSGRGRHVGGYSGAAVTFPMATAKSSLLNAVTMPLLQELDIQPDTDSYGKLMHCQVNPPHVQWLQIPLSSPCLRVIRLEYMDILKDDWVALLQSLRFETVEQLIFKGTNFSDKQAGQLLDLLRDALRYYQRTVALKVLKVEGSLVTGPVMNEFVVQVRALLPDCELIV